MKKLGILLSTFVLSFTVSYVPAEGSELPYMAYFELLQNDDNTFIANRVLLNPYQRKYFSGDKYFSFEFVKEFLEQQFEGKKITELRTFAECDSSVKKLPEQIKVFDIEIKEMLNFGITKLSVFFKLNSDIYCAQENDLGKLLLDTTSEAFGYKMARVFARNETFDVMVLVPGFHSIKIEKVTDPNPVVNLIFNEDLPKSREAYKKEIQEMISGSQKEQHSEEAPTSSETTSASDPYNKTESTMTEPD